MQVCDTEPKSSPLCWLLLWQSKTPEDVSGATASSATQQQPQQPQAVGGGAPVPVTAREVTLNKKVLSGSVGSGEPRPSFEKTYQLGKELGHGSFSTVREGTHKVCCCVLVLMLIHHMWCGVFCWLFFGVHWGWVVEIG